MYRVVFLYTLIKLINPTPLFITPLINGNDANVAQSRAKVDANLFNGIESYSGYLTVNPAYNSNLFFWYFPPLTKNRSGPIILWLQGGPGASSLVGLFTENGPFRVNDDLELITNPWSWNNNYHLLYIDNPVGTGFSFTHTGYVRNQVEVGLDLYVGLTQFLKMFPILQNNSWYLAGESYAGKYIPALAYTILQKQQTGTKINLKGLIIGNGTPDPYNQVHYGDYLYQIGLIDRSQLQEENRLSNLFRQYVDQELWSNATQTKFDLLATFQNSTGFTNIYNYLWSKNQSPKTWMRFVSQQQIRNALHVGDNNFSTNGLTVFSYLYEDFSKSVAPWIRDLLDYFPILFYNGQLDLVAPYPRMINFIEQLNFTGSREYQSAKRCHWYVGNELAGYFKVAGNLVEVLVRNAGHMVPRDQPEWALDLINRFINKKIKCL